MSAAKIAAVLGFIVPLAVCTCSEAAENKVDSGVLQTAVVETADLKRASVRGEAPMKIAIVPLINRAGGWLEASDAKELMSRFEKELQIPLNNTMRWAEYVPEGDAERAFFEVLEAAGKKAKFEEAAKAAAENIGADLLVCLVVDQYYQQTLMSWRGEVLVDSSVSLGVYGYDVKHGRVIKERANRWERGEYSPRMDVQVLAMEALEEALSEAKLRSAIFPLSKKNVDVSGKNSTESSV